MILETKDLTKQFGGVTAVNQLDFSVPERGIRAVIGPNGAGKTTLLRLIMGELPATSGQILFNEQQIDQIPSHARARRGIAKAFQIPQIFPTLSVYDNVHGATRLGATSLWPNRQWRRQKDEQTAQVLSQVGLGDQAATPAAELSHGDQKRLEIGLALGGSPQLLLLDEPTAGLGQRETDAIMALILTLRERMTIIMVEHDMHVVMNLAQTISVLHLGALLAEGTPDEIRNNPHVQDVYLSQQA